MSATPRSQAARQFASSETCLFPGTRATETELKPPHFGESAKLINATMDKFFLNYSDCESDIKKTHTRRALRQTLASELEGSYTFVQSNPAFYDSIHFLQESQYQRHRENNRRWSSFEDTITAGFQTAFNVTENIYDTLSPYIPATQLCNPKTSSVSRHIALLHNRQFVAFRDTYLQWQTVSDPPLLNIMELLAIYSDASSEWIGFKPEYPANAPVLRKFVNLQGQPITFASDISVSDVSVEPMVAIEAIELPEDSPLVGCPLTFTPEHMKAFWDIYCTERSRIDRQQKVGTEAVRNVQRI